jgi:uncharacterized protein (DUF2235 family)
MKRIAVCLDGTWQNLQQERRTNIGIIARSIAHRAGETQQFVMYLPGVGSKVDALNGKERGLVALTSGLAQLVGGVFGAGLEDTILDAYLQLAFNYDANDELYIFGFSRGAFAARSLAGLIGKCGILSRRHAERAKEAFDLYRNASIAADDRVAVEFRTQFGKRTWQDGSRVHADHRPKITYLGVFDTVGQRGMPSAFGPLSDWANKPYAFHDLSLGGHVEAARHAVAIDERRAAFPPTLWDNLDRLNDLAAHAGRTPGYRQRWFVGAHGDVGGGSRSSLSAFPLGWIVEGAEAAGLRFDRSERAPLTEALAPIFLDPAQPISRVKGLGLFHPINWMGSWRKIPKPRKGAITIPYTSDAVDVSAALRRVSPMLPKPYRPPPLAPFSEALDEIAAGPALIAALVQALHPRRKRGFWR